MFGISFTEIAIIVVVALVVVGPQKLPGMLRTLGTWVGKLRRLTSEVREQTGIDEILRSEGIDGGLSELRSMVRGDLTTWTKIAARQTDDDDTYPETIQLDGSREYPVEGPDAHDALPDDLVAEPDTDDADGEDGAAGTRTTA